jgi:hypothetical protein
MSPLESLPTHFVAAAIVSGEKTRDAFAASGKVACFHRFPTSKYHLIRNFRRTGSAFHVPHNKTSGAAPDPFDVVPLNRR